MARTHTRTLGAFAATAAAVMILGGPPAGATVVERGSYSNSYSFSHDECGFDVLVEGTTTGHLRLRAGKGKTDTAFFALDNYSFTETQTNPETGEFVTIEGNAVFNEIRARRVEGTIFEFWAVEAGQFRMYDSDGRLVARDRGSIQFHALFDTEGDDEPGAIFIEEFPPKVHGPHPGFEDFCGLITPLIGP
jgi:hypothetical protein